MLSKSEQAELRGDIFRHLDGIAVAPTAIALHEKGVHDRLLQRREATLGELTSEFKANAGYLNVALRALCSQGWLRQTVDNAGGEINFELTGLSEKAFAHVPLYSEVIRLLKFSENFHPRKFEVEPFRMLEEIFANYKSNYGIAFSDDAETQSVQRQILKHIEGILIGRTVVGLGMGGMFHKYFMEASFRPGEFHNDPHSFGRLLDFLVFLGWFDKNNGTYGFTEKGLFFLQKRQVRTASPFRTFRPFASLTS